MKTFLKIMKTFFIGAFSKEQTHKLPYINIRKEIDHIVLEYALPGLNYEDVNIDFTDKDQTISVSANKKGNRKINYLRRDFNFSKFNSVFVLNFIANGEQPVNTMEDGILSITYKTN